jgi:hypothetical protein
MTRFIYLADTHCGANPLGYQQQPGYPQRLPEMVAALRAYIRQEGHIDFVLHGGDLIDQTTDANIRAAAELFDLPVPVYLCLGNHDLTMPGALARWLELAPQFFPGGRPEFTVPTGDALIHVVPNHWEEEPYHWTLAQAPHFRADQLRFIEDALAVQPDRPHLLVTHSPVYGVPVAQTGLAEPLHGPPAAFTESVTRLAARYPNLVCLLGAHNHLNMCVVRRGVRYVTVAALVETPFEFKVFTVADGRGAMTTESLAERLGGRGDYNPRKAYAQGRPADRVCAWGDPLAGQQTGER